MKIALICPSNIAFMPYVNNYETILTSKQIDYEIINWDKRLIENDYKFRYKDLKSKQKRSFIDYYKYSKFIIKCLSENQYDKVIIFGIQLTFFLRKILQKRFKNRYIIDIRDRNKIINFFNLKKVIENSSFTVISSSGYKEWLPKSDKYIINHNTQINNLDILAKTCNFTDNKKINIAFIGANRDYKINIDFINSLRNSDNIDLYFHGEGAINKDISHYLNINNIKNVFLTGRYKKQDEESLYKKSDVINGLIPDSDLNSKTLLPNRLYNAVLYAKPMIVFRGTYLAEQVQNYQIGIILNSFDRVEEQIINYLDNFDAEKYEKARTTFFKKVIKDNKNFKMNVEDFISLL